MGLAQFAQNGVSQLSSADPYEGLDKLKEVSVGKMNDATVGKAKQAGEGARNDMGGQAKDGVADSIARGGLVKRKSGGVDGLRKARRLPAQQSAYISAPLSGPLQPVHPARGKARLHAPLAVGVAGGREPPELQGLDVDLDQELHR